MRSTFLLGAVFREIRGWWVDMDSSKGEMGRGWGPGSVGKSLGRGLIVAGRLDAVVERAWWWRRKRRMPDGIDLAGRVAG
jgi:hypothetical protein